MEWKILAIQALLSVVIATSTSQCTTNSDIRIVANEYLLIGSDLNEMSNNSNAEKWKQESSFINILIEQFSHMSAFEMASDAPRGMVDVCHEMLKAIEENVESIEAISSGVDRSVISGSSPHCPQGQCTIPFYLRNIWQYGCWCNFGNDLMKGSGLPQDNFDTVCKSLQLCLRCAKYDGVNEGYECDPITKDYNAAISMNYAPTYGRQSMCSQINANDRCAETCCACDSQFIGQLLGLLMSGNPAPEAGLKLDSGFNQKHTCREPSPQATRLSCCGYYPFRFPYNEMRMSCCDNGVNKAGTYNLMTQVCCHNNSIHADVKSIGTC